MLIYWANPAYWPHFSDAFYEKLGLNSRLSEGMAYHFSFMWLFALNGFAYVAYLIYSGEWRELFPRSPTGAFHVVLHDLKIRKDPLPNLKFNHAQRFAYTGIIVMGFGSLISGLAIYKPVQLGWLTSLMGGYESARLIHYLLTVAYILFFLMHVAQVIRAGWNAFRAMVAGYEIVEDEK